MTDSEKLVIAMDFLRKLAAYEKYTGPREVDTDLEPMSEDFEEGYHYGRLFFKQRAKQVINIIEEASVVELIQPTVLKRGCCGKCKK